MTDLPRAPDVEPPAQPPAQPPARLPTDSRAGDVSAVLQLKASQTAQALAAIRAGEVDALFVQGAGSGAEAGRMFTLDGADRAYRLLIEDMAEGALTLTPDGHIAYANRRFAGMLGRPLNQVIGAPIADCFAPEAQLAVAALQAAGHTDKQSAELDLLTDAGARVPVFLSVSALTEGGLPGDGTGMLGLVVTDLTGQKRSEAEAAAREELQALVHSLRLTEASLRDSLATQHLLEACVANLNDIVLITEAEPFDEPGPRIVFVNDAFTRITGYTRAEALGRTPRFLQGAKTDKAELARVGAALKRWEPVRTEIVNYAKDGTEFWIEMHITPVANEAGWVTHWVAIESDISDRKQAEATRRSLENQVREAQKMEAIGTLAGGIAHDFNNILAAILGNVALAQLDLPASHPARARLEQIAVSGGRARSLVEQILTFSRREPPTLTAVSLVDSVHEAAAMLRATLPATVKLSVRVVATSPDPSLRVRGDPTQLQQVLLNLCTNAWHALPDGSGSIEVHLNSLLVGGASALAAPARTQLAAGSYVHLSVTDSGRGMDEATRDRVFEPFFTTKAAGQGTGLGLSVVHGIVASSGGAIAVSSRPGGGSRFDIYFPQLEGDAEWAVPEAAAPPPVPGRGEHVLYVDDDEVLLLMVEHLLLKLGYSATCLIDPLEALAAVRERPGHFDVVVTDFNMPQMSGLELVRTLHLVDARLPVVISSGYIPDQLRSDADAAGVVALMRKENTLDDLAAMVERALAVRGSLRHRLSG